MTPACQRPNSRKAAGLDCRRPRGTVIEVVISDCSSQFQPPHWLIELNYALESRMCDLKASYFLRSDAPTKGTYPFEKVLHHHCCAQSSLPQKVEFLRRSASQGLSQSPFVARFPPAPPHSWPHWPFEGSSRPSGTTVGRTQNQTDGMGTLSTP